MPESPSTNNPVPDPSGDFLGEDGVPSAFFLQGVWQVFTSQPGLSVVVAKATGLIEFANESFANDYMPMGLDEIIGRRVSDLFSEPVAAEIMGAIARVEGTKTQLVRHVMLQGLETQVTYRWLAEEKRTVGRALVTLQRGFPEPGEDENVEIQQARYIDLGPLSALSDRELEVLALLGQGLRVKAIAAQLFRSPKTVESHLYSIFRKTKTKDRAELMRIAREAGLSMDVIRRPRVEATRGDEGGEDSTGSR
jgi:DNA-binding CsgD family transcriptional regulator